MSWERADDYPDDCYRTPCVPARVDHRDGEGPDADPYDWRCEVCGKPFEEMEEEE